MTSHIDAKVGIIGIGKIGLPIATLLVKAGAVVHGYRRSDPSAFVSAGGIAQPSAQRVAAATDIIITCLPDERSLRETVEAVIEVARSGQTVIEMSTLSLACKFDLRNRLESCGIAMLDCPILGLPPMVSNRKGVVFCSGTQDEYASVVPLLDGFTDSHVHVGDFGCGSKYKYVTNTLIALNTVAAAEATALAEASGLDASVLFELVHGSAASSTMFTYKGPMMVARQYQSAGGTIDLLLKDASTISQYASGLGVDLPALRHACGVLEQSSDQGDGDLDTAAIYERIHQDECTTTEMRSQ